MMPYEVTTNAFHSDVVSWLQENVGQLLWSNPILEWRGQGWSMHYNGNNHGGANLTVFRYLIRIDDAKLANLTALRWA